VERGLPIGWGNAKTGAQLVNEAGKIRGESVSWNGGALTQKNRSGVSVSLSIGENLGRGNGLARVWKRLGGEKKRGENMTQNRLHNLESRRERVGSKGRRS